jgi:hypothetical protein
MKPKKNFSLAERTGSTLLEQFRFQDKHKNKKHTSDSMDIINVDKKRFYRILKKSKN